MKKYVLWIMIWPYCLIAQQSQFQYFPYKSEFIGYLNPISNTFKLDSNQTNFSNLEYHSFSSKGQLIKALHQQHLNDYITFNLDFHKFSQEGIFNRENLKLHRLQSNFWFKNKKQNYELHLALAYHKIRMDENGGLNQYSIADFEDPLLFPVNLEAAQNEAKNRNHYLEQTYRFNSKWAISHSFSFVNSKRMYSDLAPNSSFYDSTYISDVQTYDSLAILNTMNALQLSYKQFSVGPLLYQRHAFVHHIDSNDYDVGLALSYQLDESNFYLKSHYYLSNAFGLSLSNKFDFNTSWKHELGLEIKRKRTPIFHNRYVSNHFIFDNQFNLENTQYLNYNGHYKGLSLSMNISRITGYIYLDQQSHYQQKDESIYHQLNSLSYSWNFRKIHFHQRLMYQLSNAKEVLRFPEINSETSVWYQSHLFSKNLELRLGAKMNYFSAYYAQAYNPALASYYLQDAVIIGEKPILDAFLKLHLDAMDIELEYSNWSHYLNFEVPYRRPYYPLHPSIIKLSIKWKLFNA